MKDKDRRPKGKAGPAASSRGGQGRAAQPAKSRPPQAKPQFTRNNEGRAAPKPAPQKVVSEKIVLEKADAIAPRAEVRIRTGAKPDERVPIILETKGARDYHLIDSGDGLKLEQYGPYRIVRPEAQALWPKTLPAHVWDNADSVFTGDTDEDGMGRWRFPRQALGETWPMQILDAEFYGRFTAFRHVGVFPEQLAHWSWMKDQIETAGRPLKVLNLFGYTGVASLIAAKAGAEVTHVDASKKAIGWARENQALGRAEQLPIRWICEDAMKFIQREERRSSRYDIILTDPPKFGRGPNGEVWQLFDHLALMLDICREILSPEARGLVLTAYSIRASFYSIHELMRETMRGRGGAVESGELILREGGLDGNEPGRALSTSLFSRWVPK
ncbi:MULTISPECIES: class I SAM-dependent rRNA methyltransferase [unclassified Rhizobium]|uniref:class I SAM-dependent rRNA methyltransferase n=1 Tax=unclassified Rhizobium TaxID=2613769 RepID=UPI000715B553|nr:MULTISPECIES: class I SAM-dependent rRNA methyltransferase [unclassified Rhizobium]KQS90464.1 SAM-dependent methyltransferase [Rhizobium sp. Leaf386]KQS90633.1 SAM-dependent methyltransferase [Rhizobium sp. Leaf391]KQU10206.1 SAM-dependent methyltransferase [Rhizobium sp. Leaf453]